VVKPDELDAAVDDAVARCTRAQPEILAAGRRAFHRFLDLDYDDALQASLDEFTAMMSR